MKDKLLTGLKWFFRSFIWLFIVLLVIDIVTKQVVMNNMTEGQSITLIPNFLKITLVFNRAAAFGIGFNNPAVNRWLYVSVASIAAIGITFYYVKKNKELSMIVKACLMMILTGAIGNLIDRLFYSASNYYVVDWINFFDNALWHWVFNIADAAVVVGAFMMIGYLIVDEVKEYKKRKAKEPKVEGKVLSKTEQEKKEYLEAEEENTDKVDN